MVDFKESLKKGLQASEAAKAQRNEIVATVVELSDAVSDLSGGAVRVELRAGVRESLRHLTGLVASMTGQDKEITRRPYLGLVAYRPKPPVESRELADFEIDTTGYPVFLRFQGSSEIAHDVDSLRAALASLLENPETGEKIRELIDLKPASKSKPLKNP